MSGLKSFLRKSCHERRSVSLETLLAEEKSLSVQKSLKNKKAKKKIIAEGREQLKACGEYELLDINPTDLSALSAKAKKNLTRFRLRLMKMLAVEKASGKVPNILLAKTELDKKLEEAKAGLPVSRDISLVARLAKSNIALPMVKPPTKQYDSERVNSSLIRRRPRAQQLSM